MHPHIRKLHHGDRFVDLVSEEFDAAIRLGSWRSIPLRSPNPTKTVGGASHGRQKVWPPRVPQAACVSFCVIAA